LHKGTRHLILAHICRGNLDFGSNIGVLTSRDAPQVYRRHVRIISCGLGQLVCPTFGIAVSGVS
jgi:hypothetical protein